MSFFEAFLTDLAIGVGRLFIGSVVSLIFILFVQGKLIVFPEIQNYN